MASHALAHGPTARAPARPSPHGDLEGSTPGGRPLDAHTRSFFESRFGHDFGHVRVHAGADAARAARHLGAEAFTIGRDVFLKDEATARADRGDPRLLAHELAHVVQESSATAERGLIHRKIVDPRFRGPSASDYAMTLNAYLHYLNGYKNVPKARQVPFNPYIKPTPDEVLSAMNASPEFSDEVAEAYERMYPHDLIHDIVELSTEEEKDRLLRPLVSGKGDFPEPAKDKAAV